MNASEQNMTKHPKERANWISLISFSWLLDLFLLGYKRDLEETDLYATLTEHKCEVLGSKLEKEWAIELKKLNVSQKSQRPSMFRALVRIFGFKFMMIGILQAFLILVLKTASPILLAKILKYFSPNKNVEKTETAYWAALMCFGLFLETVIIHHVVQLLFHMGIKMNLACSSLIYCKLLRLSSTTSDSSATTIGQIINLLSNDVGRFDYALIDLHDLWISPIQLAIVIYIIYDDVDWTALLGMAMLILFIPVLAVIGKMISTAIPISVMRTDTRLKLMNEVIRGIQSIKMYAWEKPFCNIIEDSRLKEMKAKKKVNFLNQMIVSFETYVTKICFFISIAAYVYVGNEISGEKVYMLLAYYNSIKSALFISFPYAIEEIINVRVSLRRIENFLMLEERPEPKKNPKQHLTTEEITIRLEHACAKWDSNSKEYTLKDINLELYSGNILGIIGEVGSGKSSLLQVIIQELPLSSGTFEIFGKIAYTSQEPWIFSASIRQNILFGKSFDQERYEKVISICELERDLLVLPYGDKTIIGDRGITLSGGQRARINLARAVYSDADIYIFDDPLSAVDSDVGKSIFEECLVKYLRGKTIVLVTHQLQYMKFMDHIVCLENGKIAVQGGFDELLRYKSSLIKYLSISNNDAVEKDSENKTDYKKRNADINAPKNEEIRTKGKLSFQVYINYLKAAKSLKLLALIVLLTIICKSTGIGTDYIVAYWVNQVETSSNMTDATNENNIFIIWFGSITLVHITTYLIVLSIFYEVSLRISTNFHKSMFNRIIHATMSFFHSNPSGHIMSRFSKDIQIIDQRLPKDVYEILDIGINIIFIFIIISYVNPVVILPSVLMLIILYFIRDFFIRTSRSVRRLEGLARSPVFDHISASYYGIPTIRAFEVEQRMLEKYYRHTDLRTTSYYISRSSSAAFGMYIDLLATVFMTVIVFVFLYVIKDLLPGDVGLVLTQVYTMLENVQWGVRISAELENEMISVERALEYTKVEQEPPFECKPENKPPKGWPHKGRITFLHLCIKYDRNNDRVLHNLNFEIMPKEKIGIVGRTGAGKSSIISALFRLAYMEGEIYIDEIPISTLGVHDLRSKISIIPQEPFLFDGTLRKNLDPFDKYKDVELWQVLDDVKLKDFVEGQVAGLETKVYEGGSNYSVGQRQLFCLARTILKKNTILILDEATANVDLFTDELIQHTIREKFKDCTVLTIAHRLNTIMDCDRILVVDSGKLVEFDKPSKLLDQKKGFFFDLVQKTGTEMAQTLTNIAKNVEKI